MPTEAQARRFALGGSLPQHPGFGPRGGGRLADMMMYRGEQQAEAARAQGDIWGNAIQNIGETVAGGIQQHAAETKLKKRDAAWLSFVNEGKWAADPKLAYAKSVEVWGPEEGPKQFQALAAASQLSQPKRNPEADMKALGAMGGAYLKLSPEARKHMYPQIRALAGGALPEFGKQMPEQYDPAFDESVVTPFVQSMQPKAEGFTLSPGQQRIGADGKVIAAVPPEAPKAPNLQTVETAAGIQTFNPQTGEMGPVVAKPKPSAPRDEPLVAVMGPDGESVLVPRSQAAGKRPASAREQGRPVLSGDANRFADLDTSLDDLKVLRTELSGNKATGVQAQMGAALPNVVTEFTGLGADAKAKQATIDRVRQVIGKALEEGVLRKEDESKYQKILPVIGDPEDVVAAKLAGLEKAIIKKRARLAESLGSAGFDTERFQAGAQPPTAPRQDAPASARGPARPATRAEFDALPSGATFIAPDGSRRRKP